jgi:hypothetical protein
VSEEKLSNPLLVHFSRWWPLWFAAVLTAGFVWWAWSLALEVTTQGEISARRWDHFLSGRPNELGDTLAGFVGSLTLIWVVASVFQQSMELRAQRHEFEEMVQAMEQQVDAMKAQSDLLTFQRTALEQNQAKDNLERSLSMLVATLRDLGGLRHWEFLAQGNSNNAQNERTITHSWEGFAPGIGGGSEVDEKIQSSLQSLRRFKFLLDAPGMIRPRDGQKSAAKGHFERVLPAIEMCQRLKADLSDVERLRLERLELENIAALIEELLHRDLWDPKGRGEEQFTQ